MADLLKNTQNSEVVFLSVDSPNVDPEGDEAVNILGKAVGFTTSGCYSPVLGSALAMASLPKMFCHPGTEVQVMLAGQERKGVVLEGPPALTHAARERLQDTNNTEKKKIQAAL